MRKDINHQQLIVNPANYRFDPVENQDEAIDLMLKEKGPEIFNLAKHVLSFGIDKAKDSRVQEIKPNIFLVLDGNRRVTAVKCLNDPDLIKDKALKNRFLGLLKSGKAPIDKLNCYIYDDEKSAAAWIKLDHTGKNQGIGQDSWGAAAIDRFDHKFSGKISPAMQTVNLLQQKTGTVLDTKALKISTVNRILSNPESRSYLGIDVQKGQIVSIADEPEIIARLEKLFSQIIAEDITVAKVYNTPDSVKFMKGLFGNKPKPIVALPSSGKGKSKDSSKKAYPKSTVRKYLIPKECVLVITEQKINNVYRELRDDLLLDNSSKAVPNAAGVLFRVFLEVSLDFYIARCGVSVKSDTKLSGKITKVAEDLETKKTATSQQLINIRKVATTKTNILSINNFHDYVHSFKAQPSPDDLKIKWDNLQEFFEILWAYLDKKMSAKKHKV